MRSFLLAVMVSLLSAPIAAELLPPPEINIEQQTLFNEWQSYYQKTSALHKKPNGHNEATYLNELIFSESPYLLQHAHNPVNWKPWQAAVLQEAKSQNKLIFLSIGYSTCHWCQVMEKESFVDAELAQRLNKDYLAIKVDREELPHIDDYYASALEHVKGSAGWPISAIITGDGLPLFIDSYLTKKQLTVLLTKINRIWLSQPDFLLSNAQEIDALVRKTDQPTIDIKAIEKQYLALNLNKKLLEALDVDQGGFKGEVKFPSEAMLLYGLDQLRRAPNPKLEAAIKLQLDNMLTRGLYDPIDGGFHRYSTHADWTTPHFEKMLYNQVQLIEVYAQAYQYFKEPHYLTVVKETSEFLFDHFYIQDKGFASAMDANFKGVEGGYHLWSQAEITSLNDEKGLLRIEPFNSKGSDKFHIFLPQPSAEITRFDIQNIRLKLQKLRAEKGSLNIDHKILTGWNGLAIKSLVTASHALNNLKHIQKAQEIAHYLWDKRFQPLTGYLSRTGFKQNQPEHANSIHLEDYAYFTDALIALYDATGETSWLSKARNVINAATEQLQDSDGGFFNTAHQNSHLALKKNHDSELISAPAVMLHAQQQLSRRETPQAPSNSIQNLRLNLQTELLKAPLNHLYSAFSLNQVAQGSTANIRYFASAKGKITFLCQRIVKKQCLELDIHIQLADGWHINSNTPLQDYLIPTQVVVPSGFEMIYPQEKPVVLGFQKEPLSVFEGDFKITIKGSPHSNELVYLKLPLQACSDNQCLLPESFTFLMK